MPIYRRFISTLLSILLAAVYTLGIFSDSGITITGAITYSASFSLDQKSSTVKSAKQRISGKLNFKDKQTKVTYKVFSEIDKGLLSFKGEADISNGTFLIDGLKLKPQANRIEITVTAPGRQKETRIVNINYDSSSIKDTTVKNVRKIKKDSELLYVDNNLLVYFEENVSTGERQKVIDTVSGKCVGYVNGINMWQVEVAPAAFDDLVLMAERLTKSDKVFYASYNLAQAAATMADPVIPDDPWNGSDWSELNPENYNWSVEAVQAPSAWSYDWAFKHINVGIVDAGVDNEHEDLAGKIFFPDTASEAENDPTDQHGTHVAGIMGAIPNNDKGVTGILWDTNMYCVDWDILAYTDANVFAGLTETVQAGAKVVNFSLGLAGDISSDGAPEVNPYVISYAHQSEAVMTPLLNADYDFIVCESAGNGHGGYSIDAVYNGYFCSVTEDNLEGTPEMVTKINERIIVVGSAMRNGALTFQQVPTSNAGSQVDICAPGNNIYSCLPGDSYGNKSGTSMASPIAAAIAALAWSVNPALTGAEVRSLVLSNTSYEVADNTSIQHPLVNTYRMVNAKLAVEAALASLPVDVPIFKATPAIPTNGDVTVKITFPLGSTGKEYKIDDGIWTEYTSPFVVTANCLISTRYTDTDSNSIEKGSLEISNIDKDAPETPKITATPTDPTTEEVTVTINYPDDAKVKQYKINGGEWKAYSNPLMLIFNCTVFARCADAAGNTSETGSLGISNISDFIKITKDGSIQGDMFSIKVPWYRSYKKISLQLGFTYRLSRSYDIQTEWRSNNPKVTVDPAGRITNIKTGARAAVITVNMYDANGNFLASDEVKIVFYKFKWELNKLSK